MEKPEKPLVVKSYQIAGSSNIRVIKFDQDTGIPQTSTVVVTK